ncbi:MAG: signal recognition particle-docking protein FtsY [Phycisphaerales bacterium]|jgi:fused signal recognition particle receptor|nr:signal recognition particle-docking protein FtsY [Phycisphaerales bacterium]
MGFFKNLISKVTDTVAAAASSVTETLSAGLAKTKEVFVTRLKNLILGRKLDESLLADVERMLLEADVGVKGTTRIITAAREDFQAGRLTDSAQLLEHLKTSLKALLAAGGQGDSVDVRAKATFQPAPINLQPTGTLTVILVTGINGAGKTTSIAKLTAHLKGQGRSVLLAACDTFRAGAVRQLEIWGERLGVDVVKGHAGADPAAVAFDACKAAIARKVDVLIVDTAGRLQTQDPLMKQLGKIRAVLAKQVPGAPHEALIVLDATTGQNAVRQAEEFGKAAGITGIILSKLDGTAKGGVVVAIRSSVETPVKFIGTGERPEDFAAFDPEAFVEAMFTEAPPSSTPAE